MATDAPHAHHHVLLPYERLALQAIRAEFLVVETWIEVEQAAPTLAFAEVRHQAIGSRVSHEIRRMAEEIVGQPVLHPSSHASRIVEAVLVELKGLRLLHVAKHHHLSLRIALPVKECRQHVDGTAARQEEHVDVVGMSHYLQQEHLPDILVPGSLNAHTPMHARNLRVAQVQGIEVLALTAQFPGDVVRYQEDVFREEHFLKLVGVSQNSYLCHTIVLLTNSHIAHFLTYCVPHM